LTICQPPNAGFCWIGYFANPVVLATYLIRAFFGPKNGIYLSMNYHAF
jgi:hypothetical protein